MPQYRVLDSGDPDNPAGVSVGDDRYGAGDEFACPAPDAAWLVVGGYVEVVKGGRPDPTRPPAAKPVPKVVG